MAHQANSAASHFLQYETYIPSGNPLKATSTLGINALALMWKTRARPAQKKRIIKRAAFRAFPAFVPFDPIDRIERGMRGASFVRGYVCGRVYNIIIALDQIWRSVGRHFSSEFNRGVGAAALIKRRALSPGGRIVIVAPWIAPHDTHNAETLHSGAFAAFGAATITFPAVNSLGMIILQAAVVRSFVLHCVLSYCGVCWGGNGMEVCRHSGDAPPAKAQIIFSRTPAEWHALDAG